MTIQNVGFSNQSMQVEWARSTRLIIWNEFPMQYRNCVAAVDLTLCDVCDIDKPFKGMNVVYGGDFMLNLASRSQRSP